LQNVPRLVAFHFVDNLKRIKEKVKIWAFEKRQREDQELKNIETTLQSISEEEGGGYLTVESKDALLRLEERRNKILKEKEETWRLKNRAI